MRYLKSTALTVVLSSLLFTAGCSPFTDNNTVEEIAPVIFWSVNDAGNGKIKISTLAPPLIKEQKNLLSINVSLLKQAGKTLILSIIVN